VSCSLGSEEAGRGGLTLLALLLGAGLFRRRRASL
jgi:MYXO-CTERM domain-containing protein